MEKYDYKRAITHDIIDYIHDNKIKIDWTLSDNDIVEDLVDLLWDTNITGNDNLNYYGTEDKCSEYLCGNSDLLYEAAREFCLDDNINILLKHYEDKSLARYFDTTIRCYLLNSCVYQAIKELKKEEYEQFFRKSNDE